MIGCLKNIKGSEGITFKTNVRLSAFKSGLSGTSILKGGFIMNDSSDDGRAKLAALNAAIKETRSKVVAERTKSLRGRVHVTLGPGVENKLIVRIAGDMVELETYFDDNTCHLMTAVFGTHGYVITHDGKFIHGDDIGQYFHRLRNSGANGLEFELVQVIVHDVNTHLEELDSKTYVHAASAALSFTINIPDRSPHSGGGGLGYIHQNDCEWVPAP
jgi:hypothetical protein